MQPVLVVHVLEDAVEARAEEARVQLFVGGDDAREELLECEGGCAGWEEVGD